MKELQGGRRPRDLQLEERHLAVKDEPELFLVLVDVVRRRMPGGVRELHQGERVAGRGAREQDPGLAAEEPERLTLGRPRGTT